MGTKTSRISNLSGFLFNKPGLSKRKNHIAQTGVWEKTGIRGIIGVVDVFR
jgi:hypothetical protein